MKNLNELPQISQKQGKSILDYTPFELSQMDAYQNKHRGFDDEDDNDAFDFYAEDEL